MPLRLAIALPTLLLPLAAASATPQETIPQVNKHLQSNPPVMKDGSTMRSSIAFDQTAQSLRFERTKESRGRSGKKTESAVMPLNAIGSIGSIVDKENNAIAVVAMCKRDAPNCAMHTEDGNDIGGSSGGSVFLRGDRKVALEVINLLRDLIGQERLKEF